MSRTPDRLRIGLLLDHLESDYHSEMVSGVLRAARQHRARVFVLPGGWLGTPAEPVGRNFVYDLVPHAGLDGVLAMAGSLSNFCGMPAFQSWSERLAGTPCLMAQIEVAGRASYSVDNEHGTHAVISHLIEQHQRRRIAFVRGPAESVEAEARRRAYLRALTEHGLPIEEKLIVGPGLGRQDGIAAVGTLLETHGGHAGALDAIACVNDDVALGVQEELARRGIGIPDPVAVVGFDDATNARTANPPLTTVNQNVAGQGAGAAELLLEALEAKRPLETRQLKPTVVLRASCGCVLPLANDSKSLRKPTGGLARSFRLLLIERRSTITANLARAASGRLAGVAGWEAKLLDALGEEVSGTRGGAFLRELEKLSRRTIAQGRDPSALQDLVTTVRLQAVECAAIEPEIRPEIEDLMQDARLLVTRLASDASRDRQDAASSHLRSVTKACLALVGTADAARLAHELDEHLPALGIEAFSITRLRQVGAPLTGSSEFEIVARRTRGVWHSGIDCVTGSELGFDASFDQEEALVLEPLEFNGVPIGLAGFTWGAHRPVWYEQLRELLSTGLYALRAAVSR
jgi:DNA-binding LacI/PurR family transcriptional regulator